MLLRKRGAIEFATPIKQQFVGFFKTKKGWVFLASVQSKTIQPIHKVRKIQDGRDAHAVTSYLEGGLSVQDSLKGPFLCPNSLRT